MKELTLMNRYHQTQGHPKPPVEQRVKVMDTLDKNMQIILPGIKRRPVGRRASQTIRPIVHSIFERPRRLHAQTHGIQSVDITTRSDRNGDKGRDRGGNIGKLSENYENQGRAIGTENESRP
jgi:hypothetical protein